MNACVCDRVCVRVYVWYVDVRGVSVVDICMCWIYMYVCICVCASGGVWCIRVDVYGALCI